MNILNEIKQQYKSGDVSQKLIFINILVFILSAFFFDFISNQFIFQNSNKDLGLNTVLAFQQNQTREF